MFGIPTRALIVIGVLGAAGVMWVANGGKPMGSDAAAPAGCEMTVVADILNVRSGPADTQPIVSTVPRDSVVKAERTVENGFRLLSDGRWVNNDFVKPTSGSNCG
ncbi:SH3 domain-containing protein [Saccharothrix obliqua]|uniref:SH3 domain-containing protein n=1 Tax=Saccharothrix obliqua TaxID=2861747 RepID=UPI001C5DB673|nr:SH3 domain-containing protein [Saccharothrix obliqua]MBW4716102.1 SH3 domain-containing protein [Saccharothrix obliqua]